MADIFEKIHKHATMLTKFIPTLAGDAHKEVVAVEELPAISGSVYAKIPFIPVSSILTRPSGTTPAAGDVLGTNFSVSAASQHRSNPIRLTIGTHGLTIGSWVPATIASVGGNTNANGNRMMKVIDSTKVDLYNTDKKTRILSNAAYTSGGTVACLHYFPNFFNVAGGQADIILARVRIETNAAITTTLKLYFYKTQPTATLDDAIKPDLKANEAKSLGFATILAENVFPSGSDVVLACDPTISHPVYADSNSTDLFVQVVTNSAITLQASKSVFVELIAQQRQ